MPTLRINGAVESRDDDGPNVPVHQAYLPSEIATRARATGFGSLTGWLPNPDPILRKSQKSIEVYKDLLSDAHTGGAVEGRKAATLALKWMISREGVSDESIAAPVVAAAVEAINIRSFVSDILDAPLYGYAPLEVMWRIDEFGWCVPSAVIGKPPEWFVFDNDNEPRFLSNGGVLNGEYLPPRKFLIPRHGATYENQYGTPVLSRVYWPVQFKRGALKYWIEFLEKFGGPWVKAHYPSGMEQGDVDEFTTTLASMTRNGTLVLPDNTTADIVTVAAASGATGLYAEFIATANAEISKAIVGHTGGVESTPGKLGSEDVALGVRGDIVLADKELVTSTVNALIDWIYELNFPAEAERVRFLLYEEEDIDLNLATRDKTLTEMGVTFTKEYFKNTYDLGEDDFTIPDPPKAAEGDTSNKQALSFTEAMKDAVKGPDGGGLTPSQEALNNLPGMLSPEIQTQLMKTLAAPLVAIVRDSSSYAEAMMNVARAYPQMNSEEVEGVFERMLFVADVLARNEEQTEAQGQ